MSTDQDYGWLHYYISTVYPRERRGWPKRLRTSTAHAMNLFRWTTIPSRFKQCKRLRTPRCCFVGFFLFWHRGFHGRACIFALFEDIFYFFTLHSSLSSCPALCFPSLSPWNKWQNRPTGHGKACAVLTWLVLEGREAFQESGQSLTYWAVLCYCKKKPFEPLSVRNDQWPAHFFHSPVNLVLV